VNSRPERERRDEPAKREPASAPPPSPASRLLALQRSAGNAAVASMLARDPAPPPPVVAPPASPPVEHHTQAELEAMTLFDLNKYAEAQADWATDPGLPAPFKAKLRTLLEFAREDAGGVKPVIAGCGTMTVANLLGTGLDATVRSKLRSYAQAVSQAHVTIEVDPIADVARAQVLGAAIAKLEAMPGPGVSHAIFKPGDTGTDPLALLVDSGKLDNFIDYCRRAKPLLEAPGWEVVNYLILFGEAGDPLGYLGKLPDVRNFHRFEKDALDAAVANRKDFKKDKPLYLILHSNFDHNGAFHRDPNMTAIFTDHTHLALLIEGKETLGQISGEIGPLAHTYGMGNKVAQVMFAGHGNNDVVQMAGKMDKTALDAGKDPEKAERGEDVTSAPGQTAATDKLMHELVANMATDGSARIVLNACLTASNSVNSPLDADPKKAAGQVQAAIAAEPSLATYLGNAAAVANVKVMGANASFGQVTLMDPSGNLDIVATGGKDPQLTAAKVDYVKGGTEPQGALRAVLEVWAADHVATPPTTSAIDAINKRLTDEKPGNSWELRIIHALYDIVSKNPEDAELIRLLGICAGDVYELKSEANCRVDALASVPAAHVPTIFTQLMATAFWATVPRIGLVVLQRWLHEDASKKAAFLTQLGGPAFNCLKAKNFVDLGLLGGKLAELLPVADAPTASRGQLELALLGAKGAAPDPTCKAFLRAVVGGNPGFPAALGIDALLGGFSTQGDVETSIGLRDAVPDPADPDAGKAKPNNVDLDGDGVNDFRVEPITRRGAVIASALHVRERPDITSKSLDLLPNGTRVQLIGTSGDWYAIEHAPGTAFVHKDWVRLADAL
jgi:hypothetical protein